MNESPVTIKTPVVVGLVENEATYRDKIKTTLEEMTEVEKVLTWESAESFWRDPAGRTPGLLFLDIKLGGMNGVELAGRINVPGTSLRRRFGLDRPGPRFMFRPWTLPRES